MEIHRCVCGRATRTKSVDAFELCCAASDFICAWHLAVATLTIVGLAATNPRTGARYAVLDSVAFVLREHAVLRREINRAGFEGQREAQVAAREGYEQGLQHGLATEDY